MNLRALLLLNVGADARLSDEMPEDEVATAARTRTEWLRSTLTTLVQTLSRHWADARQRQFQVQTGSPMLTARRGQRHLPVARYSRVLCVRRSGGQ